MTCEYQIRVEVEDQEREIQIQPEAYNQASGGTIEITENGTYDVTKYQTADVAVPLPQGQIEIKQNGIVNVYDYAEANVAVPADTSDIFNTTIVSDEANVSNTLKEQFINYDSISVPDTFDFNISVATANSLFSYWGFKNLKVSGEITGPNGNMNNMFSNCSNLTSVDLSGLNLSNVINMNAAFMSCSNLSTVNFGEQTISDLQFGNQMFQSCTSLTNIDLSRCNIALTNNFSSVFSSCSQLEVANLGGFNTSQLTACQYLLGECRNLQYINLSGWTTESLTNNRNMFWYGSSIIAVVIDSPSVFRITSSNAFSSSSIKNGGTGFVYVPDNLVDEYKSATNWTTVADQIKPLSELPQEVKDVFNME